VHAAYFRFAASEEELMKQVLQDRNGLTVVRDVPPPSCLPGSVLVRNAYSVISSGTERSRVELAQKSLLGKARERPDLVREVIARTRREGIRTTRDAIRRRLADETPVGYSSAGVVLEVGEAVSGFTPGDRVACAGGGHANHAEIVSVPANLCTKVPDGVGLESAALTTIGSIALHAVRLAEVQVADRVAVIGCGLVGQITCRLLLAAGADIFALDVDSTKVETAVRGGAHHGFVVTKDVARQVVAAAGGIGVDEALVTAASRTNDPLLLASAIVRDRSAIVLVGDVPIEFPRAPLYDKEISFRVSRSYGPGRSDAEYEERGLDYPIGFVRWTEKRNMEAVLDLVARGGLRLDDLIEAVVPVEDAVDAYRRLTGPAEERPRGAIVLAYADTAPIEGPLGVEVRLPAAQSARRAAKSPLRIALVGPGRFAGRVLVPALERAGAQLELVCGGSGPSAEAAMRTLGFSRIADSEDAAISDQAIDAVVIATRHASHAALTARALEAGKHVFCEKPLALTLEELEEALAAAAGADGIMAVGFNRRYSPTLRELHGFVNANGHRLVANYRVSAGPISPEHWIHDLSQGGGRALGEVCHFVDSIAFVAGSAIESVNAVGYGLAEAPVQALDNLVVTLSFANGSVGGITYVADGSPRLPKERLEVFSRSRTAVLDDYRNLDLLGGGRHQKRREKTQDKGHLREIEAFIEGAARGEPPVPLPEIANVSLATLAIVESLRTGRPVRVAQERLSER
jgi:predicted dehydrogenase/threonine dehydrogenase-like Zn-dependent dehydrogenase